MLFLIKTIQKKHKSNKMKKINSLLFCLFLTSALLGQTIPNVSRGLNFDDDKYKEVPVKAMLTRGLYVEGVAAKASLKKYCPTPKSQGNYGTCVGWSSNWAARTILEAKANNWTDTEKITANAYSPGFVYNQIKESDDANCSFGTYVSEALKIMKTKGSVKFTSFEESCSSDFSQRLFEEAAYNKIKDYARIFGTTTQNRFKIEVSKKSLAEGKPIVIGMKCPESFTSAKGVWRPTEDPNGNFGGHAMCIIGYDDNKYGGAFEVMNSWGSWWGNKGFMWIKYEDYANFVKYGFEIIPNQKAKPPTISDLSGALRLELTSGNAMTATLRGTSYQMNRPYRSGTSFRIYISNNEPAYVYAIGTDLSHKTYPIFPYEKGISAALTYSQNDVALPDENHYIKMDNTKGKDYICVLYSKNALNMDDIRRRIEASTGTFQQRVQKVMGSKMVDFNNVNYSERGKIGFSAISKGKSVVALILEMRHI